MRSLKIRRVRREDVPSADERRPKYRWVLISRDKTDWIASTENSEEGLPAFERMIQLGEASEIVEVSQ